MTLPCKEVEVILTSDENGHCFMQIVDIHSAAEQQKAVVDRSRASEKELSGVSSMADTMDSLVQRLTTASRTTEFLDVLKNAWVPADTPEDAGNFSHLNDEETLLHTIPLFHKLLSSMTSPSITLESSFACADLLTRLCLGKESALLFQPSEVLASVKRLVAAHKKETREGALRCLTHLIKNNSEYCQCFLEFSALDFILDQIDYENEAEVATYACKSVLSLVQLVKEEDDKLETLLSRALPALVKMLKNENDITTKLSALHCLESIRDIEVVSIKLQENEIVELLAPLLKLGDPEIKTLSIDLFGKHVNEENSADLRKMPAGAAYELLKEMVARGTDELESIRLRLLECILDAVHRKEFLIDTPKAQFFSDIILKDTKACASKAIDVLAVSWDIHAGMADDLAKSDMFLAELPRVLPITQAALHIIHSMFHADVVPSNAMSKNLSTSDLEALKKQMEEGTNEVAILVLDIFAKLMQQEGRIDDALSVGLLEDLVERFDNESVNIKTRCWKMCAFVLEERPKEATQRCLDQGLFNKYEILFTKFLDNLQRTSEPEQEEEEDTDERLGELISILHSLSTVKSGAKAICMTDVLTHLLNFITPNGIRFQKIHDIFMNVLTFLPVTTSRLLAEQSGFTVLSKLIDNRDVQLKRLGFEILKGISFKECSSYVEESGIVSQLCSFLYGQNPKLKKDTVSVLCRMAKADMDEVCNQIAQSVSSGILWTASQPSEEDGEEKKILWKIIRNLKSIEANQKAEKKRNGRSMSRRTSVCSISTMDFSETIDEDRIAKRATSFTLPNGLTKSSKSAAPRGQKRATSFTLPNGLPKQSSKSVAAQRQKTAATISCDSDIALEKTQATSRRFGLRNLSRARRQAQS